MTLIMLTMMMMKRSEQPMTIHIFMFFTITIMQRHKRVENL